MIYNNMNFKDIVRDEVLKRISIIRNLTTAVIIIYLNLPGSSLQQSIHDGTKHLNIYNIFTAPAISGNDNNIRIYIFIYLISDAIRKVHLFNINTIFDGPSLLSETETALTISTIPEINLIATNKTKF